MELKVEKNVLLSDYTTLHIGGVADFFVEVNDVEELREALRFAKQTATPPLILGGGSNLLINDEGYRGLVIKNCIKGISYSVHRDSVFLTCGAGEIFDTIVEDSIRKNYWGLENLSSIPGTIGATPIQNVGAYGIEVSSLITEVSAINIDSGDTKIFGNSECEFSYRNSFFKTPTGKGWIITKIVFKLSMIKNPVLTYGALSDLKNTDKLTPADVRKEIIKIRAGKFPDWKEVGTAGSFFKNPIIPNRQFLALQEKYPDLPGYLSDEENTKVSLGWVLDKICGLKGFCQDGVCLYKDQALVLVNESAKDALTINKFANYVSEIVKEKTGIDIEREVTSL